MTTPTTPPTKKVLTRSPALTRPAPFDPDAVRPRIQHLLDAENPDMSDPAWPLFVQYEEWEREEWRRRENYKSSHGADKGISMQEAQRMSEIGRLGSEGEDYMLIHTKEALRFFIGRGADPDGQVARIPGAKTVATALRYMWLCSGEDHPYADWALIMAEEALGNRIKSLEQARERAIGRVKALEQQGLHISLLRSERPAKLDLGFKSPYGFLVAQLVVIFDSYVRAVKTLQARDLLSSDEARLELRGELRPLRALFDQILRQQTLLMRPAFTTIKRPDFASKSADVSQRITEINALWPGLPEQVLNCQVQPRHVRRPGRRPAPVGSTDETADGLI